MSLDRSDVKAERRDAHAALFRDILERRALSCVFQPILSYQSRSIFGYEALIRGPKGSIFQSPIDLFDAASDSETLVLLSSICVNKAMSEFAARRLPGKLFLNISPDVVAAPGFDPERGKNFLDAIKLRPDQIVIELTEHQPTFNFERIRDSLLLYQSMGFQVAIDDLGEGFSSLRLWSELKPEFVKADKHFVTGIADDPIKTQFLKAIVQIAESCGSQIIAEGIESEADFRLVRELGVSFGQGYFIGKPMEKPATTLSAGVVTLLADNRVPVPPSAKYQQGTLVMAGQFAREVSIVGPTVAVRDVIALFGQSATRYVVPVVERGRPVGLIARRHVRFIKKFDDREAAELGQQAREIMNVAPLIIDKSMMLSDIAAVLANATPQHLADGFIVVDDGRYLGMGAVNDILRVMSETQLTAARYTNPMTLLPGPVPTNEHIAQLLKSEAHFTVCLAEIDPMKGFNDAYGFQKGDELIRLGGSALRQALDERVDFVGHIHGNRFVLLLQSVDWRERLAAALEVFQAQLNALLSNEILVDGGFVWKGKRGRTENRPPPRLAIGASVIVPAQCESRHDVMASAREANVLAKNNAGSNIHVVDAGKHPSNLAA
ncbi:MAG: GGDEF domain-containing protein [Burkholderiales bacterium]|nr:GGDEF domain-containing protein [Burkholderiales bacterium]